MQILLCAELDASEMGEEEREYMAGMKDVEGEDDVGAGDQVDPG